MIKVAIATKSAEKIAGIKEAMYRIYKAKQEIQFYYKAVDQESQSNHLEKKPILVQLTDYIR